MSQSERSQRSIAGSVAEAQESHRMAPRRGQARHQTQRVASRGGGLGILFDRGWLGRLGQLGRRFKKVSKKEGALRVQVCLRARALEWRSGGMRKTSRTRASASTASPKWCSWLRVCPPRLAGQQHAFQLTPPHTIHVTTRRCAAHRNSLQRPEVSSDSSRLECVCTCTFVGCAPPP